MAISINIAVMAISISIAIMAISISLAVKHMVFFCFFFFFFEQSIAKINKSCHNTKAVMK